MAEYAGLNLQARSCTVGFVFVVIGAGFALRHLANQQLAGSNLHLRFLP
ncbi:hypothetical protein ACVWZV_000306 [Bradyrhizobium sp. GM5.1]